MASKRPHIVIIGGGFGGIQAAKLLAKEEVDITIIDRNNFHLFQPLLYQVSTAMLTAEEIGYPIRNFFRKNNNVDFFMAHVTGVDKDNKIVHTEHGDIGYDYLILAAGGTTNFFGMTSVEENSYSMKTLQEALHIRNHVLYMFERANRMADNEEERRRALTFVVVGGGPTGIEEAGGLVELVALEKREFHNLDFKEVKVILLEGTDTVLPMLPENLQKKTIEVLKAKGIDVRLNAQVVDNDGRNLKLKDGTIIPSRTVIWAAGVKAVPFIANCGFEVDRAGRVIIDETILVTGSDSVFAIGDCANYTHGTEHPLPAIAPVAMQQAKVAATNIMKIIHGDSDLVKFQYKDLGTMATIGRGSAVMLWKGMTFSGFFAWVSWLFIHLLRLAGSYSSSTVALKWLWNWVAGIRLGRIITSRKVK